MDSCSLDKKIASLEQKISEAESEGEKFDYSKYMNIPLIAGGITPFIIAGIFALVKPKFVLKKEDDKSVLDWKKLIQWTLVISVIVWIGLYLYSYSQGTFSSLSSCPCSG